MNLIHLEDMKMREAGGARAFSKLLDGSNRASQVFEF